MGSFSNEKIEKAKREYLKAEEDYHQLHGNLFPVRKHEPVEPLVFHPAPMPADLAKLDKAQARVAETWEKYKRLAGL